MYKEDELSHAASSASIVVRTIAVLDNDWQRRINLYVSEERAVKTTEILQWWKQHEKQNPNFVRMTRDYLAIPAKSVAAQRLFSRSFLKIRKHRNQLNNKSIQCLMAPNSRVLYSLTPKIISLMDA